MLDAFEPVLAKLTRPLIESSTDVVYGLLPDLTIAYVNPAWWQFAAESNAPWEERAWGPGDSLGDTIAQPLLGFYQRTFSYALSSGEVVEHDYECSTPTERRVYRMRIVPFGADGLVVVNSLRAALPYAADPVEWVKQRFVQATGLIVQCSYCRRVKHGQQTDLWCWVPSIVEQPPLSISHGMCGTCAAYWFGPGKLDL